jgi:hypothetical protein
MTISRTGWAIAFIIFDLICASGKGITIVVSPFGHDANESTISKGNSAADSVPQSDVSIIDPPDPIF